MAILAVVRPTFQPAMRVVSSITNAFPALVTTTFKHQYGTGMIVRLDIPQGYGMMQANQLYGPIVVTGDTTFTIDIDTTQMDPFAAPMSYPASYQSAQCVSFAEVNSALAFAVNNVLPYSG